jgi:anthranilate synthase component 1
MPHRPSFDEFVALSRGHTVVPVYRRLVADALTPVSAFAAVREPGGAFLFESVVGGERVGRYSFVGAGPVRRFQAFGDRVRTKDGAADWEEAAASDPLAVLEHLIGGYSAPALPGLPRFLGGAVGFAGYDAVRYVERLPNTPPDDRGIPDLCFGFYDEMVIFDHINKTVLVVVHAHSGTGYQAACGRVDALVAKLAKPLADLSVHDIDLHTRYPDPNARYESNFTRESWEAMVRRGIEYIHAGDVFQYVPSQRFRTTTNADPFDIYRALRVINPSPFMFFVDVGDTKLVGASPEIMCRVENGEMTVRDEALLGWPRDPGRVREMLAEYYRYVSYLDAEIADPVRALGPGAAGRRRSGRAERPTNGRDVLPLRRTPDPRQAVRGALATRE